MQKTSQEILKRILIKEANALKNENEQLEEGWKENILALSIAAASMFGGKGAQAQQAAPKAKASTTQQIKQTKDTLEIDFGTNFESGKYSFGERDQEELKSKFASIGSFIQAHPGKSFKVNITASESKVPNYDKEEGSKTYNEKLGSGELAQKRAAGMKYGIESFINKLKQQGISVGEVSYEESKTMVGGPEWQPEKGDKSTDQKFTDHQFVDFQIIALDSDDGKTADYSNFSSDKTRMFDDAGHVIADIRFATSDTKDITKQGTLDTRRGDVLVQFRGDFGPTEKVDYLVDGDWWNQNKESTGNRMTQDFKQKIKSEVGGKVKEVPAQKS